ncbi:anti-phage-associated helicase HerA [Flavobacterium yafengii]|uniref:anti-phage-associated helicase HerA n=1 Tax=Flavobacterium yafengii TaxID=3041253 RepID=UPI0024A8E267|nr:anti-phage-associated helicase HerA [Flavobacterium yafengii]MDI5897631.1 ATP-binding protein [Flavobacterium yafengii]
MKHQNLTEQNAQVVAVFPDKVKIVVKDLDIFKNVDETLKVGSYLKIEDSENASLIAIIENFQISIREVKDENGIPKTIRDHIIEAFPLGVLRDGKFERGGDSLAIPPKNVLPATIDEIKHIYEQSVNTSESFDFASLASNPSVRVPINGNKFFNKHIAVVGSTGSGKSHTLSKIIQKAISDKSGSFSLNNSHVIIFDIHSEYKTAFPDANHIDISNLVLPYWLLKGEELEEFFLDTEANDHNQRTVLKEAIVYNRRLKYTGDEAESKKIHFDSPLLFDLKEILQYVQNRNNERKATNNDITWEDSTGAKFVFSEDTAGKLFGEKLIATGTAAAGNNGKLINFINRLENKLTDKRLQFLLGENSTNISFEETLERLLGYTPNKKSNVTVIDLSGVPFDVLSITVSLISRLIFEYGYFYKKLRFSKDPDEKINNDVPILLVFEEAHKYVPNSDLSKYRTSKQSIERIAKEGRKYGVTLLLASQRPSEISETIFSQCNNFIAMRLTNPVDQSYVKNLLPDSLGTLVDKMTSLKQGDAIIVGESIILPSIVTIDRCDPQPSSNDIPYWELWKTEWKDMNFEELKKEWYK